MQMPSLREFSSRRFGNFVLVGAVAAILNIAARAVFNVWMPYVAAIIGAFFVGLLAAYIGNRLFVFSETKATRPRPIFLEFLRFLLVNLFGLAQTMAVSLLLLNSAFPLASFEGGAAALTAHAIGVAFPIVINYLAHSSFTFGGKREC